MRIAICDDDEQELRQIEQLLRNYINCHPSADMEMESFLSIDELSRRQPGRYQLLLLDVLMPQRNGIDFVQSLRASGGTEAVIFITSSMDFALEAFSVNAVQYLLKPVGNDAFTAAMDKVLLTYEKQRVGSIAVSTRDGIRNLYYHNIVFIECARHFAYFHLSDLSTVCSRTLRQSFVSYIAPLLNDERFIHVHHSFVVNKQYIIRLNQRNLAVHGGQTVPISKERLTDVKREYLNYIDRNAEV